MKSTRIVYILISILVFAPIILLQGRAVYRKWKEKQVQGAFIRLGAAVVMCVLLLVFIISLYNFTLGYQVPLVMEQVMTEFSQKLEQNTDLEQYKQILLDRDLIDTDFQAISENDLEQAGFEEGKKYTVSIGEQAFEGKTGDTVVMYALHKYQDSSIYTAVEFKMYKHRWKALKHWVVGEEEKKEISSMKFFEIKQ